MLHATSVLQFIYAKRIEDCPLLMCNIIFKHISAKGIGVGGRIFNVVGFFLGGGGVGARHRC